MSIGDIALVVLITVLVYEFIVTLSLIIFGSENVTIYIAGGVMIWVLYVLTYPFRAWKTYSGSKSYYEKHGISRFQYIVLFKRVNPIRVHWFKGRNADDDDDDE